MDFIQNENTELSVPQKICKFLEIVQVWRKNDEIDDFVRNQIAEHLKEARKSSSFENLREFIMSLPQRTGLNELDELFEEFIELTY